MYYKRRSAKLGSIPTFNTKLQLQVMQVTGLPKGVFALLRKASKSSAASAVKNSLTIKNHDLLRFSKAISERLTNYSPLETDPTLQLEPCR